jgi:PAS domain S-box-containing protein
MDDSAFHKLLVDGTPDALVATTREGEILFWSHGAETTFGYTAAEAKGRPIQDLVLPHESFKVSQEMGAEMRDAGISVYESVRRRKDGTEFPVEISLSPLETEDGTLVSSSIRDITERKNFEQSIQKANQMKSEFLASMSHELRTPLNGIIGFTEFLNDEKPGPLNAKQKEYLTDICNSGRHLLQLINDVLDLAKIEAGNIDLNPETFPISKAITEVCAVVNGIAHKKRVELTAKIETEMGEVTLDQQKFKQICYNLLANAVKFTDSGAHVEIGSKQTDNGAFAIWVADTGIGIKQEDLSRLFREFEQLDSGTSRHFEGSGLGLALTQKLVHHQGGEIAVESEFGAGSTFTVTSPRVCTGGGCDE